MADSLTPSLFRNAAGTLEARLDISSTLAGEGDSAWPMAKAAGPLAANGVRLQDAQEPATNQELGAVGARQKTEKGEKTWVRPWLCEMTA